MTKGGFRKCLGEGGFSSVYKGRLARKEGEPLLIAFKHLKIERHELPGRRADFLRELFLQMDIDHPCVLKTYGGFWPEIESANYFTDSTNDFEEDDHDEYTPPYIVTERMTCNVAKAIRGNLLQDAAIQKRIILDAAEGLAHLHGRKIVHRDIKPENILLRLKNGEMIGNAKISDFGRSRRVRQAQQDAMYCTTGGPSGTIVYMPPEVLCDIRSYPSRQSWDVWSFGVLVCYISALECRTELSSLQSFHAETSARSGEFAQMMRNLASKIVDPVLREVAKMCLVAQAEDRPQMQRLLRILEGRDAVSVEIPESDCNQNEKHCFDPVHLDEEELLEIEREQRLSAARLNDEPHLKDESDDLDFVGQAMELPSLQNFKAETIARSGEFAEMNRNLASKVVDPVLREVANICLVTQAEHRPEMQRIVRILQGRDAVNVEILESDCTPNGMHSDFWNDEVLLPLPPDISEPPLIVARLNKEAQRKSESDIQKNLDIFELAMENFQDIVDHAMEKHPSVRQAKAFARRKKRFDVEIFCALVPKKGSRVSERWLRLFAEDQLPGHMMPKKFYYLKHLPRNMTRHELSESTLLKDMSDFSGYFACKTVSDDLWARRIHSEIELTTLVSTPQHWPHIARDSARGSF